MNRPDWFSLAACGAVAVVVLFSDGALPAAKARAQTVTLQSMLGEMTDRQSLARYPQPAYVCKQASSYDRTQTGPDDTKTWFANKDYEQFIRIEKNDGRQEWVIMEHEGPGCIVRFWTPLDPARKNQVIRFYFDGSSTPAIAVKFNELLSGRSFIKPPFAFVASDEPVVESMGGDLYLPIPFAKRCKITLDSLPFYYAINYRAYPAGTKVTTFSLGEFQSAGEVVKRTAEALRKCAASPGGLDASKKDRIKPQETLALELPSAPGAVNLLQVRIDPRDAPQVLRSAVLEATFDGEETVWCPLGEFFGCGARLKAVEDWSRRVDSDGLLTSRWVMPYQKSARIAIKNLGKQPISVTLSATTGPHTWDDRALIFHSNWRCQYPLKTRPMSDWNYLSLQGRGVYVGDTLTVFSPIADWYGEGDERIYLDDEKLPSHMGTGTEDYYGYAWGMAHHFDSPFISMPQRDSHGKGDWKGYTTTSRLRLLDAIPVQRSLKMDMEVWDWGDTKLGYAAATFWYARPGATCNRGPAPAEAAQELQQWPPPPPPAFSGAIECEGMKVIDATPGLPRERQLLAGVLPGDWSSGAHLFVRAAKPKDFVELLVAEGIHGPRRVILHATKSGDYGILQFTINGRPVPNKFDGFHDTAIPSGPIDLGVFDPQDGRFTLRVEVQGSNPASKGPRHYFGLDCVVLSPP